MKGRQAVDSLFDSLYSELAKQEKVAKELEEMPVQNLMQRPAPESWNALEAIAHLNSYARYYLPAFNRAIEDAEKKGYKPETHFKSSWIGRYSIRSVSPETRKRKLKSPKAHNQAKQATVPMSKDELLRFRNHLDGIRLVLEKSRRVSLSKTKISIEIAVWLKLSLGDFLPFLITHQSRHLDQAMEAAQLTHSAHPSASRAAG